MDTQQDSTINNQERMAAEMQRQRQFLQQQQYMAQKQQTVMQIINGLQQIDPFEVIKTINQYGIYTLPLEPQEKLYCANIILQLFSNPKNDFTVDNWREFLKILNASVATSTQMQMSMIGRSGSGCYGYNQFGMMGGGMPNMGMGGGMGMPMGGGFGSFGNPMMGGYNQFPFMNNGYQPPNFFAQNTPNPADTKPENSESTIAQLKQIFANLIYQCDPLIYVNYLLQDNYEPRLSNDEVLVNVLRQLIGNSLWRIQDNILQTIYYTVSYLFNSEYQKKTGNIKQAPQYGPNPMNMGMGMGMGMPMGGNFGNSFGMTPPMNGMGMGMPMGGGFGNPMMGGGMPNMNMGMPMGGGMPNMGMGMPMGNMGNPMMGAMGTPFMFGFGGGNDFNSPSASVNHPSSPIW
jgi:hypothetical protein